MFSTVALFATSCSPIPAPPRESTGDSAVRTGDLIPEFRLQSGAGSAVTRIDLVRQPGALVFVSTDEAMVDRYLGRIDDAFDRFGPGAAAVRRVGVILPGLDPAGWSRPGWMSLHGPDEETLALAGRFGVVQWGGAIPAQNFTVTVFDRDGRVVQRFGGLDTWGEIDLVTALDRALTAQSR
ncbi:MAG: hypothetical protein GKS06_10505 [Acidobacteria bacterium]|nr:hypothetical protein [Acidobacteriota bacterium]